jgi:hypothetical protein
LNYELYFRYREKCEGVGRGLRGGSVRFTYPNPMATLRQPYGNPKATLRQPPIKYEQMMKKKRVDWGKKMKDGTSFQYPVKPPFDQESDKSMAQYLENTPRVCFLNENHFIPNTLTYNLIYIPVQVGLKTIQNNSIISLAI